MSINVHLQTSWVHCCGTNNWSIHKYSFLIRNDRYITGQSYSNYFWPQFNGKMILSKPQKKYLTTCPAYMLLNKLEHFVMVKFCGMFDALQWHCCTISSAGTKNWKVLFSAFVQCDGRLDLQRFCSFQYSELVIMAFLLLATVRIDIHSGYWSYFWSNSC